jgi:competence protein ComEA
MRLRVGLGAGVVLVLVAAGVAVVIGATTASSSGAAEAPADAESHYSSSAEPSTAPSADGGATAASTSAFVQVVGQVAKPGLYELPAGDRVVDAVAAAGGFTAKADQASLNLAQVIADGQQIVVGVKGAQAPAAAAIGSAGAATGGMVDINTADETGLETLNGIGPALAQRILDYRAAHGGFRSVNDLQNVTGIGPKKFAGIKAQVSV